MTDDERSNADHIGSLGAGRSTSFPMNLGTGILNTRSWNSIVRLETYLARKTVPIANISNMGPIAKTRNDLVSFHCSRRPCIEKKIADAARLTIAAIMTVSKRFIALWSLV